MAVASEVTGYGWHRSTEMIGCTYTYKIQYNLCEDNTGTLCIEVSLRWNRLSFSFFFLDILWNVTTSGYPHCFFLFAVRFTIFLFSSSVFVSLFSNLHPKNTAVGSFSSSLLSDISMHAFLLFLVSLWVISPSCSFYILLAVLFWSLLILETSAYFLSLICCSHVGNVQTCFGHLRILWNRRYFLYFRDGFKCEKLVGSLWDGSSSEFLGIICQTLDIIAVLTEGLNYFLRSLD